MWCASVLNGYSRTFTQDMSLLDVGEEVDETVFAEVEEVMSMVSVTSHMKPWMTHSSACG